MRRIAVEHLLNPLRINFDLDATSFELEQRG